MSRGMPSMVALLGLLAVAGYQNRDKIAEFRERNKTIILVTHAMSDVVSLCDRAAWIDHGRRHDRVGELQASDLD